MSKVVSKNYVYAVIIFSLVVLAYSSWLIFSSIQENIAGKSDGVLFGIVAGVIGIGLAVSSLIRLRGRILQISKSEGKTLTIVECPSCNIKMMKDFQTGDYVNKITGKCKKCKGNQIITSIYMEKPNKK